jgi:hypothetical protein
MAFKVLPLAPFQASRPLALQPTNMPVAVVGDKKKVLSEYQFSI